MLLGQPYDVMIQKELALRAYYLWELRGRPFGSPEIDWYRAVEDENRERKKHGFGACK